MIRAPRAPSTSLLRCRTVSPGRTEMNRVPAPNEFFGPHRRGKMARLARFLHDLDRGALPLHVTPVVRTFFETIAAATPRPHSLVFRSLLQPALADGALRLLGDRGRPFEAMLRNTVTATIVGGGEKINVVP